MGYKEQGSKALTQHLLARLHRRRLALSEAPSFPLRGAGAWKGTAGHSGFVRWIRMAGASTGRCWSDTGAGVTRDGVRDV